MVEVNGAYRMAGTAEFQKFACHVQEWKDLKTFLVMVCAKVLSMQERQMTRGTLIDYTDPYVFIMPPPPHTHTKKKSPASLYLADEC